PLSDHNLNLKDDPIWHPTSSSSGSTDEAGYVSTAILKSLMAVESSGENKHPDSAFLNLSNLAYHSKVQSAGILTPTLIVGLGKAGTAVLQELSRMIHQQFDDVSSLPQLRLLAIDDLIDDELSNTIQKPGSLSKEHFFHCTRPSGEKLQALARDASIASWLP